MKRTRSGCEFESELAKYREAETFRRLAFLGIFISTIAALTSIIAVPALYGYMQRVQSTLQLEADYCKSTTGAMWQQFARAQAHKGVFDRVKPQTGIEAFLIGTTQSDIAQDRRKKHVGFDTFVETTRHVRQVNDNSCSCKIGPVGPPGPPGIDGRNGNDGKPGLNGKDGRDAALTELPKAEDFCFECPEADDKDKA
uniref:Col_cuticle_N domain-containing protein n=1 Tax=Ascaris lumbricoides TaxID=6252 RepID=A0A0M3I113_ASCLU